MTGSTKCYRIRPTAKFAESLRAIRDRHYRKPRGAGADLEALLKEVGKQLTKEPRFYPLEPPPTGCEIPPGWEFRKAPLSMPGLRREAQHGRLMYLVDEAESVVHLAHFYTHAEFRTRPPERELLEMLTDIWRTDFEKD